MSRPQDIGDEFERQWAERLGAKLVPGSGNRWYAKLDVQGRSFLWSLKATAKLSYRLDKDTIWEAYRAAFGPGGKGGKIYPGIALRIDGEDLVVLRATDFLEIVREEVKIVPATKAEEKRERARVPKFGRNSQREDSES